MNKASNFTCNSDENKKKNSASKPFCRGFSSIDQELNREIAMQWFSTSTPASTNFHGFTLLAKKEPS